ncbi:arylesterase [uncultured Roseovarius sp.]|uniref:arylesterase n=1 Tax=uncultured Roseovarius sp. TaxID=293344 RepID=UPI002601B65F|nr:arylesterase [uncultured Roseovarius sp.]
MRLRLIYKGFPLYGAIRPLGKVVAAFLTLVSPAWATEPITVLALGDSLTQGYGLPEGDGFVPQMRDWLSAQDVAAKVINGGVSGDTTAGGAARVDWSLTPEVDAMIVALGGNDLLRGIDPAVSRANLETILKAAQARDVKVLLVGLDAPGNYGAEYETAFEAIYPELSAEYDTLFAEDFFAGLGEGDPAALQRWFQADGIHPNARGVVRIVEALGPDVRALVEKARAAGQ